MGKKSERWCAVLLAVILVLLQPGISQAAQAVSITLSKTEGSAVKVTGGSNNSLKIRKNMKLYSGYRVTTEKKSYAYLLLDKTKAVKLDQNTAAGIKKEGKKNEVHLEYGELFFNVSKKLAQGETVNVKTSNNTMGIRGTSGMVKAGFSWDEEGNFEGRNYIVQIYDGKGYITYHEKGGKSQKEVVLEPGQQLIVIMDKEEKYVIKTKIIELGELPSFSLEEILKDPDLLKRIEEEMGILKEELEQALIENRKAEEQQEKLLEKKREEEKKQIGEEGKIIYGDETVEPGLGEERGEIKGESSTGGSTGGAGGTGGSPLPEEPEEVVSMLAPVVNEDRVGIFDASLLNEELEKSDRVVLQTAAEAASYMVTDGQVVIGTGKTLTVPEGMSLNSSAALTNSGTFENNGKESFHNYGRFINTGTVNNLGTITNEKGAYMENLGTFHIKPGGQCYNYAGDGSASFINRENASLVIEGSFVNGSFHEGYVPPSVSPGGEVGIGSYHPGIFSNYGTIEGTLVNEQYGYLTNQGTIEILDSKGAVRNTGIISNGYTPSEEDSKYYTLSFIEKDGTQWDMPQKVGHRMETPYMGDKESFNGWDIKLEELYVMEQDYTVREYSDAQKPECVLYSYMYDYGYGINFQDILQVDNFDYSAGYGSVKLNKDVVLQRDYNIIWETDLNISLNGHQLDLNGHSITFGDGYYGNYGILGSQGMKEEVVLNYDEGRGDYAPILVNGESNLNISNIKIQVSKGKAIELASGSSLRTWETNLEVSGGTGILAKGLCAIGSLELNVSGGTGIAVGSGGTLEVIGYGVEKLLIANISGGIGIHNTGGTLNIDENAVEKTEILPGVFLKED